MPKVTIANEKKDIEVPAGSNLREELRKAGVEVYPDLPSKLLNCRGLGLCGTCKIYVKKDMENLSDKTLMERVNFSLHPLSVFAAIGHENEIRLSCQVKVNGDCTIETKPPLNLSGDNFWQKPYPNK
jgi:ferredoxin